MFSLEELQQQIAAYQDARTSRREFFDWFESHSFDAYENESLRPICAAIDTAFSEFLYDDIGEEALKAELANAVRPFAVQFSEVPTRTIVVHRQPSPVWATATAAVLLAIPGVPESTPMVPQDTTNTVQVAAVASGEASECTAGSTTEPLRVSVEPS